MKIPGGDGTEGSISEVWTRRSVNERSTFALIGSDLYCFRGKLLDFNALIPNEISDVWKVNIRNPTDDWVSVRPMFSPRCSAHNLVVGGKLYVFNEYPFSHRWGGEVYDPTTGIWQVLPDPPYPKGYHIFSAAL
jgi:hypothetical protein